LLGVRRPSTDFGNLLQTVTPAAVEQLPEKVSATEDGP